jgi:hypothetical protein
MNGCSNTLHPGWLRLLEWLKSHGMDMHVFQHSGVICCKTTPGEPRTVYVTYLEDD